MVAVDLGNPHPTRAKHGSMRARAGHSHSAAVQPPLEMATGINLLGFVFVSPNPCP